MLQIVIWGIAAMLIVKGLDVWHRQSVSVAANTPGSRGIAIAIAWFAFGAAILLVILAEVQLSGPNNPLSFDRPSVGSTSAYPDIRVKTPDVTIEEAEADLESAANAVADASRNVEEAALNAVEAAGE